MSVCALSKLNPSLQQNYILFLDWKSRAIFPWACTFKVWNVGLYRSRTWRRWQKGIDFT